MIPKQVLEKKDQILQYLRQLGVDINAIKDENLMMQAFIHKSFAADFKTI